MPGLQEWIHKLEEGGGARIVKALAAILGLIALAVAYNLREFRGFAAPEAMDQAQIARKLATGRGFSTDFVRPLSIYLIEQHHGDKNARLHGSHPDLANPPVYPALLAAVFKVYPVRYEITDLKDFRRFQPEIIAGWFNELLLVFTILAVFYLARKWFDPSVGWMAALICAGNNLFWRFSGSGLPTNLLIAIFVTLAACLAILDEATHATQRGKLFVLGLAAAAGALVGIGMLTSYAFGWLILPLLLCLLLSLGRLQMASAIAALAAFLLIVTPWLVRNYSIGGTLFGTAGYALLQGGSRFPENHLERSAKLDPAESGVDVDEITRKLFVNLADLLENELPRLGSNWIIAFFLVGLFIPFQRPMLGRLRRFLLGSAGVLVIVQALGRTHLTSDSPVINSENYLVVITPLLFIYGASMLSLLLDQLPNLPWRAWIVALIVTILSAPLILQLLPPRTVPVVYPPYYPPVIQISAHWMREEETLMSDMPWAVAWYGNRQCLWLTLNAGRDFFEINDFQKPIQGLYLTSLTLDSRFYSQMLRENPLGFRKMVEEGAKTWEGLALVSLAREQVPTGFPFKVAAPRLMRDQLFLTDRVRWRKMGQ